MLPPCPNLAYAWIGQNNFSGEIAQAWQSPNIDKHYLSINIIAPGKQQLNWRLPICPKTHSYAHM
ncbi:hypothetical protein E2562_010122 [Oryza meyeriana var. granulata]|uniref:Uncharacterized protein n=1 Tax=Oryza meyeriana var. granulata TaxID=110450 RepID=A0A6G1EKI8_9ORYZ|nr:hypothetical protein E2562_010122 [Oryza meyeriana var. granulata]